MTPHAPPLAQDLVLLGGGHAHALALLGWAQAPLPGARVTLISPDPTTAYTGMLPAAVAGHATIDEIEIDLVRLARRAGARLILDRAIGLDLEAKTVHLAARGPLPFDVLSLDIGSTSEPVGVDLGAATPVKPFGPFLERWDAFLAEIADGRAAPRAAVIGGGLGGLELAFALAWRLRPYRGGSMTVLSRSSGAPDGVRPALWRRLALEAKRAGVDIIEGFDTISAAGGAVVARDGRHVNADLILAAAGARPAAWLQETALPLDPSGFIRIDHHLAVDGRWDVFAAGDIASMGFAPRPKAGVFAVRQAPVLLDNLKQALIGGCPDAAARYRRYRPQRDYLKLISLGGRRALADKSGLTLTSAVLWHLKDRIDRAFMRKFDAAPAPLPSAQADVAAGAETIDDPLCAGCGAKIGADALETALAPLRRPARADTLRGPGDDAALLAHPDGSARAATIDHLRAFSHDYALFAEIATEHALSDIWAMGGTAQHALASLTLPRATPALQSRLAHEMLQGVETALARAGVDLIGGHSAEGAEASLGVVAMGDVSAAALAALAGAAPGDALILTKPLGAGVLLAAEMRQMARGRDIAALFETMQRSNRDAAALILDAGARTVTDVTGFGLLGHLSRMLEARRNDATALGAALDMNAVPILSGALEASRKGVRSSLFTANAAGFDDVAVEGVVEPARQALLFDPQTSGGLLAAVPDQQADALLAALQSVALGSAQIGYVIARGDPAGSPRFRLIGA